MEGSIWSKTSRQEQEALRKWKYSKLFKTCEMSKTDFDLAQEDEKKLIKFDESRNRHYIYLKDWEKIKSIRYAKGICPVCGRKSDRGRKTLYCSDDCMHEAVKLGLKFNVTKTIDMDLFTRGEKEENK